ncbi:MAG: hypothetical protein ABW185_28095 [Sedimenticola sp.]
MTDNTEDSTTVTSKVADNPKIDVQSQPKRNRSTPKLDCIERKNGQESAHKRGYEGDKDIITNLSSKELSAAQMQLLSRGDNFIPNNRKTELTKILSDIKEWERRMRLREYFYKKDEQDH